MKVLWLCNQAIPVIARYLNKDAGNKEGWLAASSEKILSEDDREFSLGVCFPVESEADARFQADLEVKAYGFYEDRVNFENYDAKLEDRFREVLKDFKPDVIHIFGTEYSHTLAMCRACENPEKLLIGIQGLCSVYAEHYFDGIPEEVKKSGTLRDALKKDDLIRQQEKFVLRGEHEKEAIRIAGNVTGRTDWDKFYTADFHPGVRYFFMNETLRSTFYDGEWKFENCEPYSIFISQGDYPIKGLHVFLPVLGKLAKKYPGVKCYVAGNIVTGTQSLKKKILISGYGRYLNQLIRENGLEDKIVFLGSLNASEMKDRFLKSNLYLSPSMMENSPNSLGEAMLLSMPVVASDVGGVKGLLSDEEEGYIYPPLDADACMERIEKVFSENGTEKQMQMGKLASAHARITHDADANYKRLKEIYSEIASV